MTPLLLKSPTARPTVPSFADHANVLVGGEETLPRHAAGIGTGTTGTGNLRLAYFTAGKTETTSQVIVVSGGTAAAATPTLARVGLYEIAADGSGALVAAIASDTGLFATVNSFYLRTWATPVRKIRGQRYAVGVLVVTAAAAPTLIGAALPVPALGATAPRVTGLLASQTDLPASFTDGALSVSGNLFYAQVLP